MLAILCPGQGSQTPGFLSPWLELPGARAHLEALGEAAGLDLVTHGTVSDADTIKDTAVAQPLIVAAGLVSLRVLLDGSDDSDDSDDADDSDGSGRLWAGHSVGEITASAAAGVLPESDAMALVSLRGRAMAEASAVTPTGMSAVLGGDEQEVLATLERHGLTPANINGGGQIVAAGTLAQLAEFADEPPAKARVIPLKVAGAFHTAHMAPAVEALAAHAQSLTAGAPQAPLLSNSDGQPVADGDDALRKLVGQVSNPVRWDLCMQTMLDRGVTAIIELSPAGTLVGLAKRAMRGVPAVALKTPDDLDSARELIAAHTGEAATSTDSTPEGDRP